MEYSTRLMEWLTAGTTIVLMGFGIAQIMIGQFISFSVVLVANGIDCMGDGFVSGIVWVGLRFVKKPANKKFSFGYYKFENLASLAAAIVMFILATYIIVRSYYALVSPQPVQVPLLGAVIAGVSAVVALSLGFVKMRSSKRSLLGSARLDAVNTIKDGTTSTLTVLTLYLESVGYNFDPYVGFILAGIIYFVGIAAIKESGLVLLDACDGECLDLGMVLRRIALNIPGVKEAHVVRLRRTGPVFFGEVEVSVSRSMTVEEFEAIRAQITEQTKEKMPEIEHLAIESKPVADGPGPLPPSG